MRHHDRQLREVGGDIVHVGNRTRVPQLDPATARPSRPDARGARVKQDNQPQLLRLLPERVEAPVVRIERLCRGVELQALEAEILHPLGFLHGGRALPRIDVAEGREGVGPAADAVGEVLIWHRRSPGDGLVVDREEHAEDVALDVIVGHLFRGGGRRIAAKVGRHLRLLGRREAAGARRVDVEVDDLRHRVASALWR